MSTDLSLNAANDPDRLLRKRSQQKISKYRQQVEATGARFEALVIGTTGNYFYETTGSSMWKVLREHRYQQGSISAYHLSPLAI